jgi:hypothetical protein
MKDFDDVLQGVLPGLQAQGMHRRQYGSLPERSLFDMSKIRVTGVYLHHTNHTWMISTVAYYWANAVPTQHSSHIKSTTSRVLQTLAGPLTPPCR